MNRTHKETSKSATDSSNQNKDKKDVCALSGLSHDDSSDRRKKSMSIRQLAGVAESDQKHHCNRAGDKRGVKGERDDGPMCRNVG